MAEMSSWDQANRRQKLGFGLEKQKENQPYYQRLLSLTVLPLNYFMVQTVPFQARYHSSTLIFINALKKVIILTLLRQSPLSTCLRSFELRTPGLTAYHLIYSQIKTESDIKNSDTLGGKILTNRGETLYPRKGPIRPHEVCIIYIVNVQ